MAVAYYISFPCEARKRYGDEKLLAMDNARCRAEIVLELLRKTPGEHRNKPESEWVFNLHRLTPDEEEEVEVNVADLLAESAPMKELADHCQNCPANLPEVPFGCGGTINYPIPAQTEKFLLSRLPDDLQSKRGQFLLNVIQTGIDGLRADSQRRNLFESQRPFFRTWGSFFSKKTQISSSQIFDLMFNVTPVVPSKYVRVICYALGYIDDHGQAVPQEFTRAKHAHPNMSQMKQFLQAAVFATVNNLDMYVES